MSEDKKRWAHTVVLIYQVIYNLYNDLKCHKILLRKTQKFIT